LQVLQEVYGLEGERLWTAASAFGGGLGRTQMVCGALAGAAIALGLQEGHTGDATKKVGNVVRPRIRALLKGFRDRFGHVDCAVLVAPYDFNQADQYEAFRKTNYKQERCHQYVRYVVATLAAEAQGQ
jgi:C_GCAxxG_C_C family probable redox protein